jgi:protein-S-isoprenylcysteine O-methyltransferase Ste14
MARERFKTWLYQYIPEPIERSTFSLLSSLSILLLFWQWRPIAAVVWSIETGVLSIIIDLFFYCGWILALYSTFMINHFHLFGLRQVYMYFKSGSIPPLRFKIRGPYKYVRYPVLLGFLIALFSSTNMTVGHLLFSLSMTFLIITGIRLKDKDFLRLHPKKFLAYKKRVNAIIPIRVIMKKRRYT